MKYFFLVFVIIFSVVMIVPIYAITGFDERVTFSHLNKTKELGNYTLSITLTDLLKKSNIEKIEGQIGYAFEPKNADSNEKKYYYRDFNINSSELPKTFYFDVSFTDTGAFTVTKHFSFFNIVPAGGDHRWNSFHIVEEYSKAIDKHGKCKNNELSVVTKPDFSTGVCVKMDTISILRERGWH